MHIKQKIKSHDRDTINFTTIILTHFYSFLFDLVLISIFLFTTANFYQKFCAYQNFLNRIRTLVGGLGNLFIRLHTKNKRRRRRLPIGTFFNWLIPLVSSLCRPLLVYSFIFMHQKLDIICYSLNNNMTVIQALYIWVFWYGSLCRNHNLCFSINFPWYFPDRFISLNSKGSETFNRNSIIQHINSPFLFQRIKIIDLSTQSRRRHQS